MGILDSIVEWIATQIMNLLDLVTGSVLGALGCDMSTFLRYFPAAETLYEVFAAIAVGFILLNLVWHPVDRRGRRRQRPADALARGTRHRLPRQTEGEGHRRPIDLYDRPRRHPLFPGIERFVDRTMRE